MGKEKYNLTGTKTLLNLSKAFIGESQARNRYTFYAEEAGNIGYPTLRDVFLETADQERGHAEAFYDYLADAVNDTSVNVEASVPVHLSDTSSNLLAASKAEHEEWQELYPKFAHIAEQEGFTAIATSFNKIATVEGYHYTRYKTLFDRMRTNMLFSNPTPLLWQCTNCGLILRGNIAPSPCPACHHPQAYFKIFCSNVVPINGNDNVKHV